MNRASLRLIRFAWAISFLVVLIGLVIASFFLTSFIYNLAHLHPSALLIQVVNFFLGLILTAGMIAALARFATSRGWMPEDPFRPILEALERIAQGNFSTRLDLDAGNNRIVGRLATSVNRMAAELDQLESMRQEFISNVSHEIQSPLTSIRGFALALENDDLSPEERRHYLEIIRTESARLSQITEQLLNLAALESDRMRFEPKPYRLDRQIRDLVLACEPQWTEKALDVDMSLEELEVTADELLLSQVWNNPLHNSIKFTPLGGRIRLSLTRLGEHLEFRIADTGIGISEADQAHVFERFFKADRSRTRAEGGSGLGLSIAKKIVEIHKGTIAVESSPGSGATFVVSLPISCI
jgi:signal transduction histidine kinase